NSTAHGLQTNPSSPVGRVPPTPTPLSSAYVAPSSRQIPNPTPALQIQARQNYIPPAAQTQPRNNTSQLLTDLMREQKDREKRSKNLIVKGMANNQLNTVVTALE